MDKSKTLKALLDEAKRCPNKGRLYVFESYKKQLGELNLSSAEYDQACRQLATYLRV